MPPFVSRKRHSSPAESPTPKRRRQSGRAKASVFDTVDAHRPTATSAKDTQAYLDRLNDADSTSSSDDPLDDGDEDVFEDVPGLEPGGTAPAQEDEDEEMDWEDAIATSAQPSDPDIGNVTISITEDASYATATDRAASTLRKGPSKRERQVRNGTHCVHVQALVWHHAIRNSWLNDSELHQILLGGLPEGMRIEIDKYRSDMGMTLVSPLSRSKRKQQNKKKGAWSVDKRGARDWETDADRVEVGAVNKSGGDPILRLLKLLTAYWRKKFTVTAPGLCKIGYMPLKRLTQEINSWKKDRLDAERHGERVQDKAALRKLAQVCEGSRDVGSQLFTALLRALGLEARMVANLQPAGIGWGKSEEAKSAKQYTASDAIGKERQAEGATNPSKEAKVDPTVTMKGVRGKDLVQNPKRGTPRESNPPVISLDSDGESSLSSAPSDLEDDASVIDVTESFQKKRPKKKFDRHMQYPNYWTEVLSPVSNNYIPVDPIVLSTVATNPELVATFEPRGKRADQAKQVICYTIAHSADGTAKDVTVRYLKKHQLPGRTKGYRMPVEKIKVYNKKGKVLKYEDYDWFKTVMAAWARPHDKRTPADDLEEATDLKPLGLDAEKAKSEVESLQGYKQSAEFVLERHLRREEALVPTAVPVKTFLVGKGDKATEEPVYKRSDVVACKTAESWHKEGREIMFGQQPMKLVPMRAVTTMRKREMEEVERETGEKAKQGLFSRKQTDWIIPPPIGPDREIPRNAFGNIDVYVPSMVPEGAVHVRLKGTARICRDLGISHAEACTGFEFGKRMAIPVITGVVIAKENKQAVVDAWKEREAERQRKEDIKRTERCLALWRKFCTGVRIMERMQREYTDTGREEDINPFVRKEKQSAAAEAQDVNVSIALTDHDSQLGGGFLRDDEHDNELNEKPEEEKDLSLDLEEGGFMVDEQDNSLTEDATPTSLNNAASKPISLKSAHDTLKRFSYEGTSDDDADEHQSSISKKSSQSPVPAKERVRKSAPRSRRAATKASPKNGEDGQEAQVKEEDEDLLFDSDDVDEKAAKPKRTTKAKQSTKIARSKLKAKTVSASKTAKSTTQQRPTRQSQSTKGTRSLATRSKYFDGAGESPSDASDGQGGNSGSSPLSDVDDDEDDEEEVEVVTPRRTTARTRARASGGTG